MTNKETKENKTLSVITGKKMTMVFSIVGMAASGFLFGWNLYHHSTAKMVVFGIMTLVCGVSVCLNAKK